MSVAEKLIAQGRVEGRVEGKERGLWIGKIQAFEEFLEKPPSPLERLDAMPSAELEALESLLHREYALRFKRG